MDAIDYPTTEKLIYFQNLTFYTIFMTHALSFILANMIMSFFDPFLILIKAKGRLKTHISFY